MTKKEHAIEYCTMKLSEKCASLTVNGRKIVYSREANVHTGKSKHMQMLCLGKESCELFIARCFVHYQSLNFLTWEYSPSRNNCRYFDWEGWEELGMFTRIICFRDSHTKHFGAEARSCFQQLIYVVDYCSSGRVYHRVLLFHFNAGTASMRSRVLPEEGKEEERMCG